MCCCCCSWRTEVRAGWRRSQDGMEGRVARLGWTVVVSGRQLMDELRSAPADELSFYYSASEVRASAIWQAQATDAFSRLYRPNTPSDQPLNTRGRTSIQP